jgi:hypothetical protein
VCCPDIMRVCAYALCLLLCCCGDVLLLPHMST